MRTSRLVRVLATAALVAILGVALAACEEGPDQIYRPLPPTFDPSKYNGWKVDDHVNPGSLPWSMATSGVKTGTTQICQADEMTKRWATMVKQPILPTVGAGGLDLKGTDWAGITIDEAQKKLCQAYVYTTGISYWGDNAELLAFFDTKTRLIDRLVTLTGYEGTISAGGYVIANNEAIQLNGKPLVNPTSNENLNKMNIAMLKAFRKDVANPDSRDCVTLNTCYVLEWYTLKRFVFNDLMLDFAIEPQGLKIDHIGINLNRSFEFGKSDVKFVSSPMPTAGLPPVPKIDKSSTCAPTLGSTWSHVTANCLGIEPEAKAKVQPSLSNEVVYADMGGLGVYMRRPTLKEDEVVPDSIKKAEGTDEIIGLMFDTTYEGEMVIDRTKLYGAFWTRVASEVKKLYPTVDVTTKLAVLKPKGTTTKLRLGTQKIEICTTTTSCTEYKLLAKTRSIVETEAKTVLGSTPDKLKDPTFYMQLFLRELLKTFNDDKEPTASEMYFFPNDESAQVLYGVLMRKLNNQRYALRTAYDHVSDQLAYFFFRKGGMRTEEFLLKDAEAIQYDDNMGDGIFRLYNFAKSPRLGLGKIVIPAKTIAATAKALLTVKMPTPTNILVSWHKEDSVSGFGIPVEGQLDKFVPAAYYGFSGNVISGSIWASETEGNVVRAVYSGAFYDELEFCDQKVSLYDDALALLKSLPSTCDRILTFSENGKFLAAMSTYVETSPHNVGLRLYITAGRVDAAYYWIED